MLCFRFCFCSSSLLIYVATSKRMVDHSLARNQFISHHGKYILRAIENGGYKMFLSVQNNFLRTNRKKTSNLVNNPFFNLIVFLWCFSPNHGFIFYIISGKKL